MMKNESDSQQEQLEKLQEDFDLEIDTMQNATRSQQEQLKSLHEHLEEHDIDIDMMQNTSKIQEQLKNLTAENRKLHHDDSLVQQQVQNKTDALNAQLQHVSNELNAKVQNEKDKLTRSFTDNYNNMQKGIQKNEGDISKLNRGLISYRTWGTHSKFVRICNVNSEKYSLLKFVGKQLSCMKLVAIQDSTSSINLNIQVTQRP